QEQVLQASGQASSSRQSSSSSDQSDPPSQQPFSSYKTFKQLQSIFGVRAERINELPKLMI
ncbi:31169_t:CDS:1, partial [Gigaspora margarita]